MERKRDVLSVFRKNVLSGWASASRVWQRVAFIGVLGLVPMLGYAQIDKVTNALGTVESDLNGMATNVINIVKILAGILAVVALVTLVVKFQEGDHEAKKKLVMWIAGLVILFVALSVIQSAFGLQGGV